MAVFIVTYFTHFLLFYSRPHRLMHAQGLQMHHHHPCRVQDSRSSEFALRSTLFGEQTARLLEPAKKKADWNTGETSEGGLVTWNQDIVEVTTHAGMHGVKPTWMLVCMCMGGCVCVCGDNLLSKLDFSKSVCDRNVVEMYFLWPTRGHHNGTSLKECTKPGKL